MLSTLKYSVLVSSFILLGGGVLSGAAIAQQSASEQAGIEDWEWETTWSADSVRSADIQYDSSGSVIALDLPIGGQSLEFVALANGCKIFDTRSAGGPFGGEVYREYSISDASIPAQGGAPGGCSVPAGAKALKLSVSTIGNSPTSGGFLRVGPAGTPPTATVLQFLKAQGTTVTTDSNLSGNSIRVQVFGGTTNASGSITGYYRTPLHATITGAASLVRGGGVVSVSSSQTGFYLVTFERDISECTPVVSSYESFSTSTDTVKAILNGPFGQVFIQGWRDGALTSAIDAILLTMKC